MNRKKVITEKIKDFRNGSRKRTFLSFMLIVLIGTVGFTACNKVTEDEVGIDTIEETNTTDKVDDENDSADTISPTPIISDTNEAEGTEEDSNQNTTESEQDNSDAIDQIEIVYYGEWVINQVQAFGIGTYSGEDAESLIGKSLSFSAEEATYFGDQLSDIEKVATDPIYTETVSSKSDFVANYRIPFDNLGIEADSITEICVTNSNGYVCTFFIKDSNTLILVGGGTYFELLRKSEYEAGVGDIKDNITLAYISAIDKKNKTITIDEVELLFSTDEKRIAELSLKDNTVVKIKEQYLP